MCVHLHAEYKLVIILGRLLMIRETDSNLYRDSRNGSNFYRSNKTMEKSNTNKTPGGRSIWKIHPSRRFRDSNTWGDQQLFDAMRSITLLNEKDNAYIDNLNNQQ